MFTRPQTLDQIRRLILPHLPGQADPALLHLETRLRDIGLDSIATVSVLMALGEEMGADLDRMVDDVVLPVTLGDLCALAESHALEQVG